MRVVPRKKSVFSTQWRVIVSVVLLALMAANLTPVGGFRAEAATAKAPDGISQRTSLAVGPLAVPPAPVPTSPGSSSAPGSTIGTLTPTLSWSSSAGATVYALAISVAPYGSANVIYNPGTLTGTSFPVPSGVLTAGGQYRWNMQAGNSAGWSPVSSSLYFQTTVPTPPAPVPTSPGSSSAPGSTIGTLTPTLSWSSSAGATVYSLAISQYPYGPDYVIYNSATNLTGASHVVPSGYLLPGRSYRWNMQAGNSAGWSPVSSTLYFQTQPPTLQPPTLLSTTQKLAGSSPGIFLEWTAAMGATCCEVWRDGTLIYTVTAPGTTFWNCANLTAGRAYTYYVKAKNDTQVSGPSNSLTCVAPTPGVTPPAPVPTSPGEPTSPGPQIATLTPTLTWQGSSGGYALAIAAYPYREVDIVFNPTTLTSTSCPVPAGVLQSGKTYRWNMQAYNSVGWSPVSTTLYFRTPYVSLVAPTFAPPDPRVYGTSTPGIWLEWSAVPAATGYEVYRAGTLIFITGPGTTFWNITGLVAGQTYTYYIRAKNDVEVGPPSNSQSCVAPGVANLTASPSQGLAPLMVTFTATVPVIALEYKWDFDSDGSVDAVTTGPTSVHVYSSSGQYVARVTVRDANGGTTTCSSQTISVGVPPAIPTGLAFSPFFPTSDSTASTVMEGGKAFRYYRVTTATGSPFANSMFRYRYRGLGPTLTAVTDGYGIARVETDWLYASAALSLEVIDGAGTPLANVQNPPSFAVTVSDRRFSEEWSLLAGVDLSASFGGPSARLGPVRFRTVQAGIGGGLTSSVALSYDMVGTVNNVGLSSAVSGSAEVSVSAGFFGSAWGVKKRPVLSVGSSAGGKAELRNGADYAFPDFMNYSRPDHGAQVLAAAGFLLETGLAWKPQPAVGTDRILRLIIERLTNLGAYKAGVTSETAVGGWWTGGAEVAITNPLGFVPGSKAEFSLADLGQEVLFSQKSEDRTDGTHLSTLGLTASEHASFLKLTLAQKYGGDFRRKGTPDADLSFFPAWEGSAEGTQSITMEKKSGTVKRLEIRKDLTAGESLFGPSATTTHGFVLDITDPTGLSDITANLPAGKAIMAENDLYLDISTYDQMYAAALGSRGVHGWAVDRQDTKTISVPFGLGLGVGLSLGLGIEFRGVHELSYTERLGQVSSGTGFLETQRYQYDGVVSSRRKDIGDSLRVFADAILQAIKDAISTISGSLTDGVAQGRATLRGDWTGVTGYVSELTPLQASYRILALPRTPGGTETGTEGTLGAESGSESSSGAGMGIGSVVAVTVGEVYIINVKDENGTPVEDFTAKPLQLSLGYTDELLAGAGLEAADAEGLALYRWDGSSGFYIHQSSVVDQPGKRVTGTITKPGQYILAFDAVGPAISDFKASDGTTTPTISAIVSDGLSGIDPASFTFRLEGVVLVDADNLSAYYDLKTGRFAYPVLSPLSVGSHSASISAQDTAGNPPVTAGIAFRVNGTAPTITCVPVTTAKPGVDITISASITDDTGVSVAVLLYKTEGSELGYRSAPMVLGDDGLYAAVIPRSVVTPPGVRYDIVAQDIDGNRVSLPTPLVVRVETATSVAVPRGLNAVTTPEGLALSWSAGSASGVRSSPTVPPDGYEVWMTVGGGNLFQKVKDVTDWGGKEEGAGPGCTVTQADFDGLEGFGDGFTLVGGGRVKLKVRAFIGPEQGDRTTSAWSNTASGVAGPLPPGAPSTLKATTAKEGVRLAWSPPVGLIRPDGYTVRVENPTGLPIFVRDVEAAEGTTLGCDVVPEDFDGTGFGFGEGLRYGFLVYAYVSHPLTGAPVENTRPARASAICGPVPPSPPTRLKSATVPGGFTLTWAAPSSGIAPNEYRVLVSLYSKGDYILVATMDAGASGTAGAVLEVTRSVLEDAGFEYVVGGRYYVRVYSVVDPRTGSPILCLRPTQTTAIAGANP